MKGKKCQTCCHNFSFIYMMDPSVTGGSKTKRKEEEKNARKKNPVRYEDTWYMPAVYTIIRNY